MYMELTRENIDHSIQEADKFLESSGIDSRERYRYRLLLEELLLNYMGKDSSAQYRLVFKGVLKSIKISLYISGESYDMLNKSDSLIVKNIMSGFENKPVWKYRKGQNIITYSPKAVLPDMTYTKEILRYMMKKKKPFVIGSIIRFLQMLFNIIEPLLSAQIIVAYSGNEIRKINIVAFWLFVQAVSLSALNYIASRLLRSTYAEMIKQMKYDLSKDVLRIKTKCMDENGSGIFTQRIISETTNVVDCIDALLESGTALFRLISLVIAFAVVSVKMLMFEIILFMVYMLIQRAHMRALTKDSRLCRSAMERHSSFASEMVRAHRDIKLMHCEDSFMSKLSTSIDESVDLTTQMRVRSMKYILLRTQFVGWTNMIYMSLLALQMYMGTLSPSAALVLFNYNGRVYSCASSVSNMMNNMQNLGLASERIYQIFNSSDYEKEKFGETHLNDVKGDIEFKDVYFSYKRTNGSEVPVLNNINLKIKAGEFVAFVGKSGCGKSTILSLISRLYDPDSGSITLDGVDLRELDQDTLRGNIEMVNQMPYIFNMSIRDNLAVVKDDLSDEEMIEACRIACIHDDIMKLPRGYQTVVGEGGVSLSGGQRQRLAIARSIVRTYPIMMLDEATSALDNITQSRIRSTINGLHGSRTIIMVAHRLSTVINCEHLFFISDGKVIAQGTHKQLLESCQEYRDLYYEESSENE